MDSAQIIGQRNQSDELTLEDFIRRLHTLTEPADLETLKAWLSRLATSDRQLQDFRQFSTEKYQRNLVAEGPWFEALLLCFEPGQHTPIHDHSGSACGVRVIQGSATETVYELSQDGQLTVTDTNQLNEGGVVGSVDMDIHQLSNSQTVTGPLVTLHIYSPPLGEVGNYSIVDNSSWRVSAARNRKPK